MLMLSDELRGSKLLKMTVLSALTFLCGAISNEQLVVLKVCVIWLGEGDLETAALC